MWKRKQAGKSDPAEMAVQWPSLCTNPKAHPIPTGQVWLKGKDPQRQKMVHFSQYIIKLCQNLTSREVKQDDTETTVSKVQHTERITHKGSLYPLQD